MWNDPIVVWALGMIVLIALFGGAAWLQDRIRYRK